MSFNTTSILPSTRLALEALSLSDSLSSVVIAGGTALALHIGHRVSEDLDLFFLDDAIDKASVDAIINELSQSFRVTEVPHDPAVIMEFEDSGLDISRLHLNYTIHTSEGPVKLSFSASDINATILNNGDYQPFNNLRVADERVLFELKTLALTQRHKKRDLFDLAKLLNKNIGSVSDMLEISNTHVSKHYQQVLLNKLSLWPQNDPERIHFNDKVVDDEVIRDETLSALSGHIAAYEKAQKKPIKDSLIEFRATRRTSSKKPKPE